MGWVWRSPPSPTTLVTGLLFVSLSPHCGPHGPQSPERESWVLGGLADALPRVRQLAWRAGGVGEVTVPPSDSWMQEGSQHQATHTPASGQRQSRVEVPVRTLQTVVYDASHVPGIWGELAIISAYGSSRAEMI